MRHKLTVWFYKHLLTAKTENDLSLPEYSTNNHVIYNWPSCMSLRHSVLDCHLASILPGIFNQLKLAETETDKDMITVWNSAFNSILADLYSAVYGD